MAKPKKTPKGKAIGPLLVMALLFLGSGAVRVAANLEPKAEEHPEADAEESQLCAPDPDISEIMGHIRARQERLAIQNHQISDRMVALRAAEAKLQETMKALEAAERRLAANVAQASTAMESDLSGLIAVYESMKPKDAATLFQTMPPEFAAGFLAEMRSEAAAAIMAGLPPEQAYGISAYIAGRNASIAAPAQIDSQ